MVYIIIILAIIIAFLQIENKFKKPISVKSWMLVFLLLILLVIQIANQKQVDREDMYKKENGTFNIQSSKDKLFLKAGFDTIELPNNKLDLSEWQPQLFSSTVLRANIENGKVFVSTDIKDNNGELIARIINNDWKVKGDKVFDKNFDERALEVIDNKGEVIFQIDVNRDNIISIKGRLYNTDSTCVVFTESNTKPSISFLAVVDSKVVDNVFKLYPIRPIFRYPSQNYKGVRNN